MITNRDTGGLQPVGDIFTWVDTTLKAPDGYGGSQGISSYLENRRIVSMASFVDGYHSTLGLERAPGTDEAERELLAMRHAEMDQCSLDYFWGLDATEIAQAEATAAMQAEDIRSHELREKIKKEERTALWEERGLRIQRMTSIIKENLEKNAQSSYLRVKHRLVSMVGLFEWES